MFILKHKYIIFKLKGVLTGEFMSKKRRIGKNSKIRVGVTCNCQKPALPRPPKLLRNAQCKVCGQIFKTNRDLSSDGADICFECRNKRFKG